MDGPVLVLALFLLAASSQAEAAQAAEDGIRVLSAEKRVRTTNHLKSESESES